jgi:hypothetical protein
LGVPMALAGSWALGVGRACGAGRTGGATCLHCWTDGWGDVPAVLDGRGWAGVLGVLDALGGCACGAGRTWWADVFAVLDGWRG